MDIKVRCKKLCVGKKLLTPPLPPPLQGWGDISNKGNFYNSQKEDVFKFQLEHIFLLL